MVLTNAQKQILQDSAENAPEQVAARGSKAVRLQLANGKIATLVNKQGSLTESGRYWYNQVKVEASGYDINTEIKKRHKTDYIVLRSGAKANLRTWHPELNAYVYTKLGKEFFHEEAQAVYCVCP